MLSYRTFTECTDNGPYIAKLILDMPQEVRAEQVSTSTFSVYVERIDNYTGTVFMTSRVWRGPKIYPSRGYRPVTAAYPCDEQGKRQHVGTHVALEMPYGPLHPLGQAQALLQNDNMNEFVECRYRVTQVAEIPDEVPLAGLVFDECNCPYRAQPQVAGRSATHAAQRAARGTGRDACAARGLYCGAGGKQPRALTVCVWLLARTPGASWARRVHILCAYWSFVAAFAHAGLHIRVPAHADVRKLRVIRVALAVVSCYGVYSFVLLGMPAYLMGQVQFAMVDYGTPLALSFARYASVAVLVSAMGYVARKALDRTA